MIGGGRNGGALAKGGIPTRIGAQLRGLAAGTGAGLLARRGYVILTLGGGLTEDGTAACVSLSPQA